MNEDAFVASGIRLVYDVHMEMYQAIQLYVNEANTVRTPASRKTVLSHLRKLASMHPGLTLDQYRTSHLVKYCTSGTNPSPNTVRTRMSVVRPFFDWCSWRKLYKGANPATDLKFAVKPGHGNVRTGTWLTEGEVADLMRTLPNSACGRRDRIMLLAGFMMGLRCFEISGLRWSQFSADLSRLTFFGKGTKLAQLGVPPQLRAELQAWRREAPVGCDIVLPRFKPSKVTELDESVPSWDRSIANGGIIERCIKIGERAGYPALRPHDLRRTYAGILEAKGVPVQDISRLLRHSDIGVTSRYLERNPARATKLADTFELAL
jgi:integrase